MAKINCPSCGAVIEIPADFVQELKSALAGSGVDTKALLAELKALIDAERQPPPESAPAPGSAVAGTSAAGTAVPAPPAPARKHHGIFYDDE